MADKTVTVAINLDDKGAVTSVRRLDKGMTKLERGAKKVGDTSTRSFRLANTGASRLTKTLTKVRTAVASLGLALVLRQALKASIEFERSFANVTTLINTARVSTQRLRSELLGLGGTLGSSTELAEGLYQALSAGVAPAEAVRFVGESAKFAKAALTDTFTAVDLLTTILNAYGLEASSAARISDELFEIVKQGKTTGQALANQLGVLIPTAASLGVNLKQVGAALSTMTKGGFSTETAVVSLNQAMLAFLKPQEAAVKLANDLGVELSASALKSKGFFRALQDLARATEGNAEATALLFGNVRALSGVLALTGPQAQEFERILAEMQNTVGNVNEAFEKQVGTLGAQLQALWNNLGISFNNIATGPGAGLASVLGSINNALEEQATRAAEAEDKSQNLFSAISRFISGPANELVALIPQARDQLAEWGTVQGTAAQSVIDHSTALAQQNKLLQENADAAAAAGKAMMDRAPFFNRPPGSGPLPFAVPDAGQVEAARRAQEIRDDQARIRREASQLPGQFPDNPFPGGPMLPPGFDQIGSAIDTALPKMSALQTAMFQMSGSMREFGDIATSAFKGFGDALNFAFQSAILGSQSLGQALRKATAQVIAAIAAQSIVKALWEAAQGVAALAVLNFPGAALHFQAAAMFGAIGGAAALVAKGVAGGTGAAPERGGALNPVFTQDSGPQQISLSSINPQQGVPSSGSPTERAIASAMNKMQVTLDRTEQTLADFEVQGEGVIVRKGVRDSGGVAKLMSAGDNAVLSRRVLNTNAL